MITVPEATKKIILRSRYLAEAISKGIINNSSLARYIKPEIEEMLVKEVSNSAIIMALNRLSFEIKPKYSRKNIFKTPPDMILRSNLTLLNLVNSKSQEEKYSALIKLSSSRHFLTITKGPFETTMLVSNDLKEKTKGILENEEITKEIDGLSAITIQLPEEATSTPGIFYFFLKSLAWEGINVLEIISTQLELTLIVNGKDINRTYSILNSLFSKVGLES